MEKQRIVAFLDRRCAEIDAVIEQTQATIEEYKKLKQSVITEAVTKGIRGDRPMKDSGIEWIDTIVESWNMSRVGLHFDIILGKMLCDKQVNSDYTLEPYFCAANIHFDGISQNDLKQMWFSPTEKLSYCVHVGDLLVVEGGAGAGGCAIVDALMSPTYVQNSVMIVRRKKNNNNRFLRYWIEMLVKKGYIDVVCNKATIPHFTKEKLSTVPYPILEQSEEVEIADYLDQKCAEIDTLIEKKTALLAEMETYKKSLIFEYVTGKKEVASESAQTVAIVYPYFPSALATNRPRFAQAVLMSKILDSNVSNMGRVKLEKMLFTIEYSLGFDFDTEYSREAAGPLDSSIYECERVVSQRNKWFYVNSSDYGVSYKARKDMSKYKKYYEQYFSDYNEEIERIITVFRSYTLDQAEIVATLYGAWNDFIIEQREYTDEDIVNEVLTNWNESKTRFSKDVWLWAIDGMRKNNLVPKGYGRHTTIKNQ